MTEEVTLKEWNHKRGAIQSKITRAGKKVIDMGGADLESLRTNTIVAHKAAIKLNLAAFLDTHEYIQITFEEEVKTEQEDAHREKLEDQVDELIDKLDNLQILSEVYSPLLRLQKTVELIKPTEIDQHTGSQLLKLEKKYEALTDAGGNAMTQDPTLSHMSDHIAKQLHDLTRAVSEALPTAERSTIATTTTTTGATSRREGFDRKRDLLKVELPVFRGDIRDWPRFWKAFSKHIDINPSLDEEDKLHYLRRYIDSPNDRVIVEDSSDDPGQYGMYVELLKEKYDKPRIVHSCHIKELLAITPLKNDSGAEIARVQGAIGKVVIKLQSTGQFTAEAILTSYTETLLNPKVREEWQKESKAETKVPDIEALLKFLRQMAYYKDSLNPEHLKPHSKVKPEKTPEKTRYDKPEYKKKYEAPYSSKPKAVFAVSERATCDLCKADHFLHHCPDFRAYSVDKRTEYVKKGNLCFNCMSDKHETRSCRSPYKCRHCNKKHHTLLHKGSAPDSADSFVGVVDCRHTEIEAQATVTIAPTIELCAQSPWGQKTSVTALYDTGATISLVSNQVVNRLGLQRRKSNVRIVQALGEDTNTETTMVKLTLNSPHVPDSDIDLMAVVVPRIGTGTNRGTIHGDWPFLDKLQLADPNFRQGRKLDLILGTNLLSKIDLDGIRRGTTREPIARNTTWGWVVYGNIPEQESLEPRARHACHLSTTQQLLEAQLEANRYLKTFFMSEDLPEAKLQSLEDAEALEHYARTHEVLKDGRFQVALPRKKNHDKLGASRPQAVKRYVANERSLIRKQNLQPFQEVVREYFALKHAERVPQEDLSKAAEEVYYLPMHAVFKASSTSTKLRVVFDASAATTNGISLNDTLLIGPTVYPLLTDIIIRFRQHDVAITADIAKMFREIGLAPSDRDFHRFVWRDKPSDELRDYRMTRVTFGVTSSPFLATQTLQQIAQNVTLTFPLAAQALKQAFYVDDLITGTDSRAEALQLRAELQHVLDRHGLNLKKWRSNSQVVMDEIPQELHEKKTEPKPYGETNYLKTLGIHWNSLQDEFHVSISELSLPATVTKRALTSDVAKTFDVLGWFAPTTIVMKMLIQQLWEEKTDWDDRVSEPNQSKWTEWREELPTLAAHPISRPYFVRGKRPTSVQLHGFSDASLKAYAAVIYVRATYKDEPPTIALVTAKTKVTPLKGSTVPRLELCGAQLLADLITLVRTTLDIPLSATHCWIDSTIVLYWLDGNTRPNKTYVENRVRRTLQNVPTKHWKHVPGIENPADCASRGVFPSTLVDHPLWWHGPNWLSREPFETPPQPTLSHHAKSEEVIKEAKMVAAVITEPPPWMVNRYSSYNKLKRCVAWILRFTTNARTSKAKRNATTHLTTEDVVKAETLLCRHSQQRTFPDGQIDRWRKDKRTRSLNPTKDDKGLIRVNGRLGNSKLAYAQRFPIILRGNDPLTRLIIRQQHLTSNHAGPTLLMSNLGRDYFLIQGMAVVKAICRNCVTCKRFHAQTERQIMGQLPKCRVTPGPPFESVGTDFAGPITTKRGHTRKPVLDKSYVCVFVCMSTKAVHLETVTDLTTAAFMACLKRFVARRGKPLHIYSDNGSNFVGACRELEEIYTLMRTTDVQNAVNKYCTTDRITWHFSPARAPHFGGIWEAAVKSLKFHLRRTTNKLTLNFEELTTVLTQIEAALNSRPLMPLHAHSTEGLDVLTPGHFLIGRPMTALPETEQGDKLTPHKRWRLCRQLIQQFWKSWSDDYLKHLHARSKWQKESRNVQVNDVVLIRGEQTYQTNDWPLARVVRVHRGKDGLVRAVDLRTGDKTCCRPIAKLSVLFNANEDEEDSTGSGTASIPLPPAGMSELETTP